MNKTLTLPIINKALNSWRHDEVFLDEKSFAILVEIQQTLSVFESIDDDEARKIWIAIPRGRTSKKEYPYEKEWFFLVSSKYRENSFLQITDCDHRYVILSNRNSHEAHPSDMSWLLEPWLLFLKKLIATIVKDSDTYNRYIEENLPYRQRSGKIKSLYLNRIIPERRFEVENREHCIQVMKELMRRKSIYESVEVGSSTDWKELGVPAPIDTMSIRTFCKYYRIADTIFWSRSEYTRAKQAASIEDDVEYYSNHGLHGNPNEYDLDSEQDFKRFATDHYGELGLSRTNVGSTNYYAGDNWIITLGISYSVYAGMGLKIAMALFETGAPFIFYDAENLLHILEETGIVRISPYTFHDYLKDGDDEGVIEIPFIEDCGTEGELTRAQYDEIVRLAEWEPEPKLKIAKI